MSSAGTAHSVVRDLIELQRADEAASADLLDHCQWPADFDTLLTEGEQALRELMRDAGA